MQILGQHINDFTLPDVNLIGEHSDAAELGRMLQLLLGCAVNCEQKQGAYSVFLCECVCECTCECDMKVYTGEGCSLMSHYVNSCLWSLNRSHCCVFLCSLEYIQTIMMMEESVQHVVMTAIQEVDGHAVYTGMKQN